MTAKTIIDTLAEAAGIQPSEPTAAEMGFNPVDAIVARESLYDPALKAQYDAEPKKRVYIPSPPGWAEAHPYVERVEINGIIYLITAEQDVMLPESVWAVLENTKEMNREYNRQVAALRRLAQYAHISQVPQYVR